MKEALRYLDNAREILGRSLIKNNRHVDVKHVKSACGAAYLGLLKTIDEYLLSKGLSQKELPKKEQECKKSLQKYTAPYNGKLLEEFNRLYDELHIAGHYRGLLTDAVIVKELLKRRESFIKQIP